MTKKPLNLSERHKKVLRTCIKYPNLGKKDAWLREFAPRNPKISRKTAEKHANSAVSNLLSLPAARDYFQQCARNAGLTEEYINGRLFELTHCDDNSVALGALKQASKTYENCGATINIDNRMLTVNPEDIKKMTPAEKWSKIREMLGQ